MIIEHFGLPLSGKTSIKKKNSHLYKNYLSYRKNFILNLYECKKIKFFTFKILNILCDISENKNNILLESYFKKLYFSFLEKILFQKLYSFSIYEHPIIEKKYKQFFIELDKTNNKNKKVRKDKVFWWFKEFILYQEIANKNNNNILDDEGILQRILSLILKIKKVEKKKIHTIIKLLPKPDKLYFVNISKSEFVNRIEYIKDKKQKLFFSKNYKDIYSKYLIVKNLIEKKFKMIKIKNIYIDKDN